MQEREEVPYGLQGQNIDYSPPVVRGGYGYWDNQTLYISWDDKIWPDLLPEWSDWGSFSQFEIQLSDDGNNWDQPRVSDINQISISLGAAATYMVRVRAVSANDIQGSWSDIITIIQNASENDYELEPQFINMEPNPELTNRITIRFKNPGIEIDHNQLQVTVTGDGYPASTEPKNRGEIEKFWPVNSPSEITGVNKLDNMVFADGIMSATVSPITPIDPYFALTGSAIDGFALPYVSFRLYSDQPTTGQLFWFYNGGHTRNDFPMESGWKIYSFNNMPEWVSRESINNIRIDPGTTNASGEIKLDWVAISSKPVSEELSASPFIQGNTANILTRPTTTPGSYNVSVNYGGIQKEVTINTGVTNTDNIHFSKPCLLIFPNPASDAFSVSVGNNAPASLSIVSQDGTVLLQRELSDADSHSIPVDHLKNGLYIVKIVTMSNMHTRKLFIKR